MSNPTIYTPVTIMTLGSPDNPIVRVANGVSATATSMTVTQPGLVDEDGTQLSTPLYLSIRHVGGDYNNWVEVVKVTAIASDDITLTVVRGIEKGGKDFDGTSASLAKAIPRDSIVEIAYLPQQQEMIDDFIVGNIASGGRTLIIGDETDNDIFIKSRDSSGDRIIFKQNRTTEKLQYTNDGSTLINMDAAAPDNITVRSTDETTANSGELFINTDDSNNIAIKDGSGDVITLINAANDVIPLSTMQLYYAADGEASDAYAITLAPAISAYVAGQSYYFKANTANTGAATLDINSVGAQAIKKFHDQDLEDNDIESGQIVHVVWDGTNFQLQTPIASALSTANAATLTDGSNADSLHTHDFVSVGADIDNTYYTTEAVWSNSGETNVSASYQGNYALIESTGASWLANTSLLSTTGTSATFSFSDSKNITIECWALAESGTTGDRHIIGLGTGFAENYDYDSNPIVAFSVDGTTLYAKTGSGGTSTITDISAGITVTNWNQYKIEYTPTEVKFYVNNTLKATHTTNIPTTGQAPLGTGGTANGEDTRVSNVRVTQEI